MSSSQTGPPKKGPAGMVSTYRLLRALLPKIPLIARVVILHVLSLSEPAQYLDLRSEVIISVLRAFCTPSQRQVSKVQKFTLRDPGIKGRIWVSKVATQVPPETDARDALLSVIKSMSNDFFPHKGVRMPDLVPVEAEWTGFRADAGEHSRLPSVSEEEKFAELNKECTSRATILYFHGGAYYLMDPSTHRPITKKLAQLTGGRCFSVRYRLAPQNPFPAALLDAFVCYLSLLYPPPGSLHEPVRPEDLAFAGDSAGGNLCLALLQVILELRRQDRKVRWFDLERDLPLPAAVGVNSPWTDITGSSPSCEANWKWDYIPPPSVVAKASPLPCDIWPANPPRRTYYVDDAFQAHPLVSLVTAETWKQSPPVYICCGREVLSDEDKFLAAKLASDGVTVVFEEFEAMPHCFAMILTSLPGADRCIHGWAGFIKGAVEDPASIKTKAIMIKAKTLEEVDLDVATISPLSVEEMKKRVYDTASALRDTPSKL